MPAVDLGPASNAGDLRAREDAAHSPRSTPPSPLKDEPDVLVMLDERIATSDLTSDHFAGQLVQRIAWALADAETTERKPGDHREPLLVRPRERSGVVAGVAC
jgi:hypothetical protein